MESLQRQALERQEFQVWYQPKYDLRTRRCIGAEALVRWQSAELGFLPPGKFIALFESNGFISDLDFYNLEQVMRFQREAAEKGLPVVPISVNQSRVHMREQGYLTRMQALIDRYATQGIELELTETAFDFTDYALREHSIAVVAALHAMGFAIDMDDFGSGYSDLSLLNQLPLDVMKIDRSLLLASEGSERMCIVLQQMIDLGYALGMKVICEGIETEAQENLLRRCGCEYGQGYLYGKPMPRAEFETFLRQHA
ncbi:MAG: EAL domain-containing protein [Veillonellaceae bacterium]|nr:EAL domain-containing protein [Veillonellaceae bacterium]